MTRKTSVDLDGFNFDGVDFVPDEKRVKSFGRDWPEAKWHVFENIWVYCGLIGFDLSFDWLINLSRAIGIGSSDSGHPYSLGLFQVLFFAFSVVQLMRNLNQWKYYGSFPWEKNPDGYQRA